MSVLYSTIAFVASVVAVGKNRGLVSHSIREGSTANRIFGIMNALGEQFNRLKATHIQI